jgi:hypothetical protein
MKKNQLTICILVKKLHPQQACMVFLILKISRILAKIQLFKKDFYFLKLLKKNDIQLILINMYFIFLHKF